MAEEIYRKLGELKCRELSVRSYGIWSMLALGEKLKTAQVRGVVQEGIARDFIREFLPEGFRVKSGLIFDTQKESMSPQIDAIIYGGIPLLEFTDVVIAEKQQVRAIFEIKTWINQSRIFGTKSGSIGLARGFKRTSDFLPEGARYILFAFSLYSAKRDDEVRERLGEICHSYAIVRRKEPQVAVKAGEQPEVYNFDNSVSRLIEWLRNLS